MTEIRLERPVAARYIKTDDRDNLVGKTEDLVPRGSWTFDGEYFTYVCPCGCNHVGVLRAGLNEKPGGPTPSWLFNGDYDHPTLHPSINHIGHWHGWLRNGWWEQA